MLNQLYKRHQILYNWSLVIRKMVKADMLYIFIAQLGCFKSLKSILLPCVIIVKMRQKRHWRYKRSKNQSLYATTLVEFVIFVFLFFSPIHKKAPARALSSFANPFHKFYHDFPIPLCLYFDQSVSSSLKPLKTSSCFLPLSPNKELMA